VLAVTLLRAWAVFVVLVSTRFADEAGRLHAPIMPDEGKWNPAVALEGRLSSGITRVLQLSGCRVRLMEIVTGVLTAIEAAGEGVPRLGGQS
jgi:hypothetical protein